MTFSVSLAVLTAIVVLIALQIPGPDVVPKPKARVQGVREVDRQFHVDVVVANNGDRTAANVQVSATLDIRGRSFASDQTVDFLAGSEAVELVFIFKDDPAKGQLTVDVTGYARP